MILRRSFVATALLALGLAGAGITAFGACGPNEPARVTIVNELPAEGAEAFTVEKAWYRTTSFYRPVKPGETSESSSVGFGKETAYFVLAIGEPPQRYLAMSTNEIETEVGEQARIVVNASTIRSTCLGTPRMSEADWSFVRERIFPSDEIQAFSAPCFVPPAGDAGADAGTEGGADAGDASGE